jgi:hypothetical protein
MQVSNVQQRGLVPFPAFTGERVDWTPPFSKRAD